MAELVTEADRGAEAASKLQRGLPTLVECDKDLAPYLYANVRNRLRSANLRCVYLDGRPRQEEQQQAAMPVGMIGTNPQVLIVNPKLPVTNVLEFVVYVKAQKE